MLRATSFCVLPFLVLYGIRKYIESRWGKCKNKIDLKGKTVIVTGANSGIGFEVAKDLALRNATVILACRNIDRATEAIARIEKNKKCLGNLIPMELNLASLASVKKFVDEFLRNHKELHILINNAGVSFPRNSCEKTKDGLEIHFGINHVGHFYLTNLLHEVLEKSKPSKVIIVSSKLHEKGNIHIDDLSTGSIRKNEKLYANSKLANIYFCRKLAEKTKNEGIDVFAVCPGWVYTNLFRHSIKWYHYILVAPIAFFFMRSPKQGAQTIIYCATEPGLQTGMIFRDCKMYESKCKFDPILALELWNRTDEIIKNKT